jgi:hypothetical protein
VISLSFVEAEDALACSQEPTMVPHPEPNDCSLRPPSRFTFNTDLSFTPISLYWSYPFKLSSQNFVHILLSSVCDTYPAHPIFLYLIIVIFGEEFKLQRFFVLQFSLVSCHVVPVEYCFSNFRQSRTTS